MYWYNRNWDEYRFVLYREVFFIWSAFYRRFNCIILGTLFNFFVPTLNTDRDRQNIDKCVLMLIKHK